MIFKNLSAHFKKAFAFLTHNCRRICTKRQLYLGASILDVIFICTILLYGINPARRLMQPLVTPIMPLKPLTENRVGKEVFGFAPAWTIAKLSSVDFDTLTTLAYFGVPVTSDGSLDKGDNGYLTFKSHDATDLFKKAHNHGTRVVLTLTQMNNSPILSLMDSPDAQGRAIDQAVTEVDKRGIDGINVDMEFSGDPGQAYRDKFSNFIAILTQRMHQVNPNSKVTVSVYASAIKEPKIYDIAALSRGSDGIFMMAYDFATAGSDNAIPTSPLYGHKTGRYWYDVSSAVEDFLTQMPANKLILGVPWYGYNYLVYQPEVKAETRPYYSWRGRPATQTYSTMQDNVTPSMDGVTDFRTGWDADGQVGWRAYFVEATGTWRMVFVEDNRSLGIKYDFAKSKDLAGIGIWALGFEDGKPELWSLLREKFGTKLASNMIVSRPIGAGDETN